MRNDACVLANDYCGPWGWDDKQLQPQSSSDSCNFATGVANEKQHLRSSQQLPDFATGVANKKQRLRSSRRLPDFEPLIEDVDELSRRRGG